MLYHEKKNIWSKTAMQSLVTFFSFIHLFAFWMVISFKFTQWVGKSTSQFEIFILFCFFHYVIDLHLVSWQKADFSEFLRWEYYKFSSSEYWKFWKSIFRKSFISKFSRFRTSIALNLTRSRFLAIRSWFQSIAQINGS